MVCTPQASADLYISLVGIPWFSFQERFLPAFQLAESSLANTYLLDPFPNAMIRGNSNQPNERRWLPELEGSYRQIVPPSAESIAIALRECKNSTKLATDGESSDGESSDVSSFRTTSNAIQAVLFMSSNNILGRYDMDNFVGSMVNSNSRWILQSIISMKTPTTEIFAADLLLSACKLDDSEIVNILLSTGANANFRDIYRNSPLHYAIQRGSIAIVRALIKHGAAVNSRVEDYVMTAMALRNPYAMVQLLLDEGAIVRELPESYHNQYSRYESYIRSATPLQIASKTNDLTMIRLLLKKSRVVDVEIIQVDEVEMKLDRITYDEFYRFRTTCISPLVHAAWNGNIPIMTAILDAGANLNVVHNLDWNSYEHHFLRGPKDGRQDWLFEALNCFRQQRCFTALQAAAHQNDVEPVRFLLRAGATIDTHDTGDTALQIAAKCGNIPMVQILRSHGADINAPAYGFYGRTVLQAAAENGNPILVNLFLEATTRSSWPAIINAPPARWGGRTALQAAAENGHIEVVRILLRSGANINGPIAETFGITVFQAAVKSGEWSMVILVLTEGAHTHTPPGTRAALAIAVEQENMALMELVLQHGGGNRLGFSGIKPRALLGTSEHELDPSVLVLNEALDVNEIWQPIIQDIDVCDMTALGFAIRKGRLHAVKLLLQAGADATLALRNQFPSIDREMLTLLLEHGADPDITFAGDELTPLARWIRFLNSECKDEDKMDEELKESIVLLLNAGAKVNCSSGDFGDYHVHMNITSILGYAAKYNCVELVEILLDAGADPNWRDGSKSATALALAATSCDEIFYPLLDAGADVNAAGSFNRGTALEETVWSGNLRRVQDLLNRGADVNVAPSEFEHWRQHLTPLQRALIEGHEEILTLLIQVGAEINAPASPSSGRTALQVACERGNLDHVRMLLQKGADVNAPPSEQYGFTALQGASIEGHFAVAVLLLQAGANINGEPSSFEGRTALEGAAEHGRLDIVHLLLENDNDMEGFYDRCENAAKFAEEESHMVIARILRNYRKD